MKEKLQRFITAFKMNGQVKKKTLIALIALVAIIAIIILLICLKPADTTPDDPIDEGPVEPDYSDRVEPDPIVEPESMAAVFEKYPDVYAWMVVPGTAEALSIPEDTSLPVAQHPTERLFYLDRDLDGNNSKAGTIFAEATVNGKYINGRDLNDPVTVLYGHNMANRTMFGGLQSFLKGMDFSQENLIYMYQTDRRVTYQIVGGVQYDLSHIIYYHDFSNDQVFNDFFTQLWKASERSTAVSVTVTVPDLN